TQPPVQKMVQKQIPRPLPEKVPAAEEKEKIREDISAQKANGETNTTKPSPKPVQKIVQTKIPRKPIQRSQDPLANMLMQNNATAYQPRTSSSNNSARLINQLYGQEFRSFTPTQQKFIENNLNLIQQITQYTLIQHGYPDISIQTRQQGTNVVSFYLHPNGDISDLRLKTRIGYQALDENTLEVIEIAYKSYPLPNQKTKIIFYVKYIIE
ncbi:MAG: hypothetical protein RL113_188, partial [Pseudomonadota bacterium]